MANILYNIPYHKYNSVSDYPKNIALSHDITISSSDFVKYAYTLGNFNGYKPSNEGKKFYQSLIDMALKEDAKKTYTYISNDYSHAEQSIKGAISFFMGMIAAKAVADKKYNVDTLFHLKDEYIEYKSKGNRHPDFFGVSESGEAFLFEAKGASSNRKISDKIASAKDQLSAVSYVQFTDRFYCSQEHQKKKYQLLTGQITTLNRHAVVSVPSSDQVLHYYDIDPEEEGGEPLSIDADAAVRDYYGDIMKLLRTETMDPCESASGIGCTVVRIGHFRIGLRSDIWEILEKDYQKESKEHKTPSGGNVQVPAEKDWLYREIDATCKRKGTREDAENAGEAEGPNKAREREETEESARTEEVFLGNTKGLLYPDGVVVLEEA